MAKNDAMSIPRKRCYDCDHFPSVKLVLRTYQNSSLPRDPKPSVVVEQEEVVVTDTAMIEEIADSKTVVEEAGNAGQHLLLAGTSITTEETKTMAEAVNGHEEKLRHLNRIAEEEVDAEEEVVVVRARALLISMVLLYP